MLPYAGAWVKFEEGTVAIRSPTSILYNKLNPFLGAKIKNGFYLK